MQAFTIMNKNFQGKLSASPNEVNSIIGGFGMNLWKLSRNLLFDFKNGTD